MHAVVYACMYSMYVYSGKAFRKVFCPGTYAKVCLVCPSCCSQAPHFRKRTTTNCKPFPIFQPAMPLQLCDIDVQLYRDYQYFTQTLLPCQETKAWGSFQSAQFEGLCSWVASIYTMFSTAWNIGRLSLHHALGRPCAATGQLLDFTRRAGRVEKLMRWNAGNVPHHEEGDKGDTSLGVGDKQS